MRYGDLNILVLQAAVAGSSLMSWLSWSFKPLKAAFQERKAVSFVTPEEKTGFEDVRRLSSFRVNL